MPCPTYARADGHALGSKLGAQDEAAVLGADSRGQTCPDVKHKDAVVLCKVTLNVGFMEVPVKLRSVSG